ncbi:MAG: IclR family transcriptional regulator [Halobacteriaceae archaeon]
MATDEPQRVQAVEHSIAMLEALVSTDGATLADLDERLGVSKSTIYHHLETLRAHGLVEKRDGEYDLGYGLLALGGYLRDRSKLFQFARPVVDSVADETGEFVALAVEHRLQSVHAYRVEGEQALPTDSYLGVHLDLHAAASGKALLANLGDEAVDRYVDEHGLRRYTDDTITDRDALFEELETVREQGYATEDVERIEGLRSVSVPVMDRGTEEVLGSVAIAGPTNRIKGERFREEYPDLLQRNVNMLEVKLTYS